MYEVLRTLGKELINPVNQLGILLVLLFFIAYFRSRFVRIAAVLVVAHLTLFSSKFALFLTMYSLESAHNLPRNAESLDAVVVLSGGTVQYNPVESVYAWEPTAHRILEGIRLFKSSHSKFLILAGATPDYTGPLLLEAESMKKLAIEWGVPEESIVLEPKAQNTGEHPVELRPIFFEKNISSFYLVTSAFHMMRATKVFEKAGYHPVPYPVGKIYSRTGSWFDTQYYWIQDAAIKEWVGLIVYKLRGLI